MSVRRRVAVTGLGAVTPVGSNVAAFWAGLLAGRSGAGLIAAYDASDQPVRIAAEVKDFDPAELFGRKQARRTDRFTQFALAAADEAARDAGLSPTGDGQRAGVILGTGVGGICTLLENADVMRERGPRRVSALMVPMMMPNAAAGEIAIRHGLHGVSLCTASACASGAHAVGEAVQRIRHGAEEVMICGGSEAAIHPVPVAAFTNMGALSRRNDAPERASRPFDAQRDGFVLGEGAGVLVLEELQHAHARGAHIYAEIVGYGTSSDAFHITAPDDEGRGAAHAMSAALLDAGLSSADIEYINAHGTGTPLNDRTEALAIHAVFGERAARIPVSSTKSMIGHLLGAAGAVEAVVCAKTLETGVIHPTVNYEAPDPGCDLDCVPGRPRHAYPRAILSNSFGFGGHNATLIFRAVEE